MPFIGNQPALSYTSFAKQDFTTSATTSYTLDNPVANENELALFINFVRQEPTTAYSASGTSLTLTSATSASDDMYCVYLGKAVQTVNPPNGSVGTAQLADDAVTKDKVSNLMYPAFHARLNSNQDISNAVTTKVQCGTEELDTDNMYDNTTNYRFTPTVAGKYYVYAQANLSSAANTQFVHGNIDIQKNGSSIVIYDHNLQSNPGNGLSVQGNRIVEMNGSSDYLELFVLMNTNNSTQRIFGGSTGTTFFGAYRIGD